MTGPNLELGVLVRGPAVAVVEQLVTPSASRVGLGGDTTKAHEPQRRNEAPAG